MVKLGMDCADEWNRSLFSLILCGKSDYASLSVLEIGEKQSFFVSTDVEGVPVYCLMA